MKKTKIIKYFVLASICIASWVHVKAQCSNQIFHTSGMITINGIQVTVISFGDCDTISTYCSASTLPYLIGANYTLPNHNGGYLFQFFPTIDSLTLNFSGINDNGIHKEIVMLYVNGNHYSIPSAGLQNGCDSLAVLTNSGDITGATNGSTSGWNGTIITGPISEIVVMDSVVSGTPNGAVFSISFCSEYTTSIFEKTNPKFSVYPIPTKGNITIEASNKSKLEISDMQGQVILQQTILQEKSDIDLSILEKGIYILTINDNGMTEVKKIVKE